MAVAVTSRPEAGRASSPGPRGSILSPAIDLLLVGGLSILVLVPLLATGRSDLVLIGAGAQAWVATLINMPHFMASYRIVYRSRESILRHRWASLGIPALLLVWIGIALWEAQWSTTLVTLLVAVASSYLAWHYTGQVWGMMASFAHLEGATFDRTERLLIRGSLRFLLAWHLTWFVHTQVVAFRIDGFYWAMTAGTLGAFGAGAAGLLRMRRRLGRLPPVRSLVAWLAIFVWYAAMARDPKAIFWVQIAHALQYLEFPIRVELNRSLARQAGRLVGHMAVYGGVLLGVSLLMGQVVPVASMNVIGAWLGEEPGRVAPVLILSFINIHHYFTDGVIWKLRNPEVQRALFAHLPAPAGATPVVAPVGPARSGKPRRGSRR